MLICWFQISELQSQVILLDDKNQSYFLVAQVENDKLNVFPISSFHKLVDANYKVYNFLKHFEKLNEINFEYRFTLLLLIPVLRLNIQDGYLEII